MSVGFSVLPYGQYNRRSHRAVEGNQKFPPPHLLPRLANASYPLKPPHWKGSRDVSPGSARRFKMRPANRLGNRPKDAQNTEVSGNSPETRLTGITETISDMLRAYAAFKVDMDRNHRSHRGRCCIRRKGSLGTDTNCIADLHAGVFDAGACAYSRI